MNSLCPRFEDPCLVVLAPHHYVKHLVIWLYPSLLPLLLLHHHLQPVFRNMRWFRHRRLNWMSVALNSKIARLVSCRAYMSGAPSFSLQTHARAALIVQYRMRTYLMLLSSMMARVTSGSELRRRPDPTSLLSRWKNTRTALSLELRR